MIVDETIDPYNRRPDEQVIEGRNKSRIVVGTDRKKERESGYGSGGENDKDSAAIDIVAGADPDPDYKTDGARLYLSNKTDPDDYFGVNAEEQITEAPAAVFTSDNAYILGRERVKIVRGNFNIILDGNSIRIQHSNGMKLTLTENDFTLGQGDEQRVVRGEDFKSWAEAATILSPMGPLKINPLDIQKIEQILSTKARIE